MRTLPFWQFGVIFMMYEMHSFLLSRTVWPCSTLPSRGLFLCPMAASGCLTPRDLPRVPVGSVLHWTWPPLPSSV